MQNAIQEQLHPLNYARNHWIPKSTSGKPINPSTTFRWVRDGLEGLDGERIRLEVVYRGQMPCTSQQAVQRFFQSVTEAPLERMARTQQRADDVTTDELEAVGLTRSR